MRFILVLLFCIPLFASAQKADTAKREPRLRDFSASINGGYGTGNLYSAGLGMRVNFRKINFKINGSQSVYRTQGNNFYVITYRGLGTYYYNYGINPATSFPATFRFPALNRLTKQASGELSWEPTKKIKIDLSGSYSWADDTIGFSVERQIFTGYNFRTTSSAHWGGQLTERKSAALDLKYPANTSNPIIKFRSSFVEETQDITLSNSYADTTSGYAWGFMANAANRDISTKVDWVNSVSLEKLWLPWVRFDRYNGIAFKRKSIRLKLAHTYREQRGISHLYTRTDLVPENGPAVQGSDRIFYINYFRPSNEIFATLSMSELVSVKRPDIEINFMFMANYSEQPWMQSAARIDATGANSEDALNIHAVLTTKQFTPVLMYSHKRIGVTLMGQSNEIALHDESGETVSKHRFMLLPQLRLIFDRISMEYKTSMLSPSVVNLLPNPDWRNPAYIEYGNPALEFGMKNELTLETSFYKTITSHRDSAVKYARSISIDGLISHSKNPVMWITQPDSAGIVYAQPARLPYLLNTYAEIRVRRQLFPSLTLTGSLNHDWLRYDYSLTDTMRTMNTQTFRAHIACAYEPGKKIAVKINGGYTLAHTDYTGNKQFTRSYQSFDASLLFDVKFFEHLRFYAIGNVIHYIGPEGMDEKTFFNVSSTLEWSKPDGHFSARLTANDLLNQNIYFARNDAHGMVQQVNGVAPGRYAMLTASWGISKREKRKE